MAEKKDVLSDWVVGGFIASLACGLISGIPGMQWIGWGAVIGIVPFCAVATVALVASVIRLFWR